MPGKITHILLVEDNPGDARLVREMLAEAGGDSFAVDWVSSLSEALEHLARGGIDLVLLDLGLPDSQGLDTFRRAYEPASHLPFLVLTGYADVTLGSTAVRQGAQDYLPKGEVTGSLLQRAIRYAIERKRTEAALEAERKKLFTVLDNLPAVVHLKSADFKIIFANRRFREVFGDPGDRPCYEHIHGRNAPCEHCAAPEVLKTQVPKKFEGSEPVHGGIYEFYNYPLCDRNSRLVLTLGIDITERKQAEEEIKLNEARLASLMRISQYSAASIQDLLDYALNEAIALTGSKIGYIHFYDETTRQFTLNTWSRDVMQVSTVALPQTIYQLEKTGIWGEAVRQAKPIMVNDFQAPHPLKKGYPEGHAPLYKYLTIPVMSDHRIVAVVGMANKASDYDDADVRQLTLMMDAVWKIVQRREVGQALRQSEARLAEAQRIAHVGSWEWDVKTNQAVWSEELFRILHLPPQDYGLSYEEFMQYVHPDDRESLKRSLGEGLTSGNPLESDYRIILGDGSQRYVHVDAEIILSESGEPALVRGTLQNITERVMAEQKLRESEERFRAIFEQAAVGVAQIDTSTGRFIRVNQKYGDIVGLEPEELMATTFMAITHQDDLQADLDNMQRLREGVIRQFSLEKRYIRRDGSLVWVNLTVSPLWETGQPPNYHIAVVEDITERRQAENTLRESEKKLRLLADQLLTAQEDERKRISSELHDELGHALLTLKLDLRSIEKQLLPEQQALAEEVESVLGYIDEVIKNVRRLYLGLSPGDLEDLGLTAALKSLIDEFSHHNQEIAWSIDFDGIDGLFPLEFQTNIYRIFQEILTNIGKHAAPTHVSIVIRKAKKGVLFKVEDNGKGFNHPNILNGSYDQGLGLIVMEERVRIMGGSFNIISQENQGTNINFTIQVSYGGHEIESLFFGSGR